MDDNEEINIDTNSEQCESMDNKLVEPKEIITPVIKKGLLIGIILLFIVMFLIFIIPAFSWSFQVVTGRATLGTALGLSIESVITFSIAMLALLVTIITLGVGFIAVVGYQQIKNDSHRTAFFKAREVAEKIAKTETERIAAEKMAEFFNHLTMTEKYKQELLKTNKSDIETFLSNGKRTSDKRSVSNNQKSIVEGPSTVSQDSDILDTTMEDPILSDDVLR